MWVVAVAGHVWVVILVVHVCVKEYRVDTAAEVKEFRVSAAAPFKIALGTKLHPQCCARLTMKVKLNLYVVVTVTEGFVSVFF